MRVLAVYSIKGGVGKTTTAVNLAYLAAREGMRTLLWDLDPQGAATFLLRVRPKIKGGARALVRHRVGVAEAVKETDFSDLDLLPADFSNRNLDLLLEDTKKPVARLARILGPVADQYDVVVMDCAPSVSLVSEAVLTTADVVVVPVVPSPLAVRSYEQLARFLTDGKMSKQLRATSRGKGSRSAHPSLLPFFSMADRRRAVHRQLIEASGHDGIEPEWIAVPASSHVERMAVNRAPLPSFAPRCPATRSFEQLWHAAAALVG